MKRFLLFLLILPAGSPLPADPAGGGSASFRTLDGRLVLAETRWFSGAGLEARSWWKEGGGSGWLRWGGLQTGPLAARTAPGGEWAWGPDPDLAEGSWGAEADLGPAGVWLVETPGSLAGGGQLRGAAGPWRAAAAFCRTWNTAETGFGDEARAGMGWAFDRWPGGWDLRWRPGDPEPMRLRLRQAWTGAGAGVSAEGSVSGGQAGWEARGEGELRAGPLRVLAGASSGGGADRFEAEAEAGPLTGGPVWTAAGGWGGRARVGLEVSSVRWKASVRADGREGEGAAGLTAGGPSGSVSAEGSAALGWEGGWKAGAEVRLEAGNLTAAFRYTRTDAVLGWLGPGAQAALTAEWRF